MGVIGQRAVQEHKLKIKASSEAEMWFNFPSA